MLYTNALSPGCSCMDVLVASKINALNGTTVKISCTFTSCYKMDITKFAMNWTYQETLNDTEEMVKQSSCKHMHLLRTGVFFSYWVSTLDFFP